MYIVSQFPTDLNRNYVMGGCSLVCLWQISSSRLQLHGVVLWRSVPRLWRLCHTKKATGMSQSLAGMFVVCVNPPRLISKSKT